MPNVPWFPPSHRPTKNAPNHIPQQQMLNQYASSSSRKHGLPSNSESSPTPKIRKYTHSFPKPSQEMQFTPGELAAKRQAAIEEEAMKKVIKDEIARKKQEEKWIELGKAVCSVTPEDIGLFDHPKIKHPVDCNGDEVIAIVANFTNNLKKLIGVDAKGTILGNTNGLAAALCSVHHKATFNIEQKVLRFRQVREELAQREKETQAREQLIRHSEASKRKHEISLRNRSAVLKTKLGHAAAQNTLFNGCGIEQDGHRITRIAHAIVEEAEKKEKREEELRIKKEQRWIEIGEAICNLSLDDFILPTEDDKSESTSDSNTSDVAVRGEEIVAAVVTFVRSLKSLIGEKTTNDTIFSHQIRLASLLCDITMSSISTRFSFAKKIPT